MNAVAQSGISVGIPPLVDDPSVKEVYADNFVGASFTNGNLHLTFAAVRADHAAMPPTNERRVVERLVLSAVAANELQVNLARVMTDLESKGFLKRSVPPLEVVQ
jgi:hypothetical protein